MSLSHNEAARPCEHGVLSPNACELCAHGDGAELEMKRAELIAQRLTASEEFRRVDEAYKRFLAKEGNADVRSARHAPPTTGSTRSRSVMPDAPSNRSSSVVGRPAWWVRLLTRVRRTDDGYHAHYTRRGDSGSFEWGVNHTTREGARDALWDWLGVKQ